MEPTDNNTRYILELERESLLKEKYEFDEKYGTFSFAILTSLEAFALVAYLYIATVLIYYKKTRTKTNFIVSVWAIINFVVLLEKLSARLGILFRDRFLISEEVEHLTQMIAALARTYGTSLMIVWFFSKYYRTPKPKFDIFIYFLMLLPTVLCAFYIAYYFVVNKYIFEVYGPGCDVVNAVVYLVVGFVFLLAKIFANSRGGVSNYALLISLVNLITNLPIGLITIYLRFNLDASWKDRFHIYFIDFFLDLINCSGAFAVMFLIILFNDSVRQSFFEKKQETKSLGANSEFVKTAVKY